MPFLPLIPTKFSLPLLIPPPPVYGLASRLRFVISKAMRMALLFSTLLLLTHCAGVSDYSPETGSRSSYQGNQGGAGIQTSIWSNDPSKKTLTNQNGQ